MAQPLHIKAIIIAAIKRFLGHSEPFAGAVCAANPKNVTIGEYVSFGGGVVLAGAGKIDIGEHTMIASSAILHTSTHDWRRHPQWSARIDRPIRIGRHVWIGTGAIILPGVIVGDYSVVGAGSVVTRHVPSRAIVVGSPARIIRWRSPDNLNDPLPDYATGAVVLTEDFLPESQCCRTADGAAVE